jgi:hypothetical protein
MFTLKNTLIAGGAALALGALPLDAALARDHGWGHHGFGPIGVVGAVVGTAAAIATIPFAVAASVVQPVGPPPGYYGGPAAYYGPGPGYRAPGYERGYVETDRGGYRYGPAQGGYRGPRYYQQEQGYDRR